MKEEASLLTMMVVVAYVLIKTNACGSPLVLGGPMLFCCVVK